MEKCVSRLEADTTAMAGQIMAIEERLDHLENLKQKEITSVDKFIDVIDKLLTQLNKEK